MRLFRTRKTKKVVEPVFSQPFAAERENLALSSSLADNLTTLQTIFCQLH